jgi:hypothetical protein
VVNKEFMHVLRDMKFIQLGTRANQLMQEGNNTKYPVNTLKSELSNVYVPAVGETGRTSYGE